MEQGTCQAKTNGISGESAQDARELSHQLITNGNRSVTLADERMANVFYIVRRGAPKTLGGVGEGMQDARCAAWNEG